MGDDKVVPIRKKPIYRPAPIAEKDKAGLRKKVEQAPERFYAVGGMIILSLLDEIRALKNRLN